MQCLKTRRRRLRLLCCRLIRRHLEDVLRQGCVVVDGERVKFAEEYQKGARCCLVPHLPPCVTYDMTL